MRKSDGEEEVFFFFFFWLGWRRQRRWRHRPSFNEKNEKNSLESSIALTSTPHSSTSHSAHAAFFPATAKWSTLRPLPSLIAPTPLICFAASALVSPSSLPAPRYFSAAALSSSKSPSLAAVRSLATCSLSASAAAGPEEEDESPPSSSADDDDANDGQRSSSSPASPPRSLGSVTTTSPADTLFDTFEASTVP